MDPLTPWIVMQRRMFACDKTLNSLKVCSLENVNNGVLLAYDTGIYGLILWSCYIINITGCYITSTIPFMNVSLCSTLCFNKPNSKFPKRYKTRLIVYLSSICTVL